MADLIEIDLGSPEGEALQRSLRERHGEAMARAATLPARLFLLRSPWAPGLRFVGGMVEAARLPAGLSPAQRFSLAGTGTTVADALVSCVAEGIERLSLIEHPGDVVALPLEEAASETMPAVRDAVLGQLGSAPEASRRELDWVRGQMLAGGKPVLVPADWCLRRATEGPLRDPRAALSTGAAAGEGLSAAAMRALLELVERDAAALWWLGGRRARPVAAESAGLGEAVRLLETLRQGVSLRASWCLDLTTDLGIPAVAALSVGRDGKGLACGLAARLSLAAALRAAIFEMCQMELALLVAVAKQAEIGAGALSEVDRRHLERAQRLDAAGCELMHPLGAPLQHEEPGERPAQAELDALTAAFARAGIEAALVDLSRAGLAIAVLKAIAPQLQGMPSGIVTERLGATIAATGGGGRWTSDIPLA